MFYKKIGINNIFDSDIYIVYVLENYYYATVDFRKWLFRIENIRIMHRVTKSMQNFHKICALMEEVAMSH